VEVEVCAFLTLALGKDKWSASRPVRFTPVATAIGTLLLTGWLDKRGDMTFQLKEIPLASPQHRHDAC
jgi:hypothetical protein